MKFIATAVTIAFVALLLRWSRDRRVRTSWALMLPILWFGIICSRPVSQWIHPSQGADYVDRFTEGSPLDASIYGVLIVLGMLVLNRRAPRVRVLLQANLPIVLFSLYCALSISWSDDPAVAFKRWIKAAGDIVMVLLVLSEENHESAIRRMYTTVASVLLPLSLLFILYYPALGTNYDPVARVRMYTGVATFKNLLGVTCMACGLGAVWSLVAAYQDRENPDRKRHIAVHAINLLLALGLVLRADSMTSFSSLALAGTIMAVSASSWVQRRPRVLVAMIAGAVAMAGFALFLDSSGSLLQELGRNPTLTGRTLIWRAVLAQHVNPVLGAGFESFWMGNRMQSVWSMSQVGIQEAHDGYLELYLNLGWVGIALLGAMIFTGYRNGLALYRRDPEAGRLRLGLLTAAVVFGFTEAGFRMMSPDWTGFLIAVTAMPLSLDRMPKSVPARREKRRREVRVLH
jgi:O-antigen ligase